LGTTIFFREKFDDDDFLFYGLVVLIYFSSFFLPIIFLDLFVGMYE